MKRGSVLMAVLATIALSLAAGCSSSSKSASSASSTTTAGASSGSSTTAGSSSSSSSSSSKVDCTKVKAAGAVLIVDPQKLAGLKSADAYALIKDGTVTYDPDEFAAALDDLKPLEGVSLGGLPHSESVTQAIDAYAQANDLAKQALASADPASSSAGQQLAQQVSDTASFLGHQTVISEAISAAHCD